MNIVYTQNGCTYCKKAKDLLFSYEYPYVEVNISDPVEKAAFKQLYPEAKTVPQIIMDDELIGGYEELKNYLKVAG